MVEGACAVCGKSLTEGDKFKEVRTSPSDELTIRYVCRVCSENTENADWIEWNEKGYDHRRIETLKR